MARRAVTGRYQAAIFDLFGTLVPEFPASAFYGTVREMASALGVGREVFVEAWTETALDRQTGVYERVEDNVMAILSAMGEPVPLDELLAAAVAPRERLYDDWFFPRPGALETVTSLRERGVPLALISMCAPDTPARWRASPFAGLFDVEVFSSEVGLRKPDPAIYRYATDRLGADPERCLYCGDGAYGELTGAEAVGMTAFEIRDPGVDHAEQLRPEGEDWEGAQVADLRELLAFF